MTMSAREPVKRWLLTFTTLLIVSQYAFTPIAHADLSNFTTRFSASIAPLSLALSDNGRYQVLAAQGQGIYISSDEGWYWTKTLDASSNGFDFATVAISGDGSIMYAGTQGPTSAQNTTINGGYLYKSTDYGITWTQITSAGTKLWSKIAVSDDGTKLVAMTQATTGIVSGNFVVTKNPELFYSTNSGSSWTNQGADAGWDSVSISSDGSRMWAASTGSGAWLSINSGTTWTQKRSVGQRSLSASSDGRVVIAIEGSILKMTSDTGTVWSTVAKPGTQNLPLAGVAVSGNGKNLILAVNNGFLWLSNSAGASWIQSDYNNFSTGSYLQYDTNLSVWISRDGLHLASVQLFSTDIEENFINAPSAPTPLNVSVASTNASLSWSAPSSAGDAAVSDYSIQYSTDGTHWSSFAHTASTATSATITGLTNGISYYFRVAGVNAWGIGTYETYTTSLAPGSLPGAPTSLAGSYRDGSVALTWNAPSSNGGSQIRDYKIEYSSNSGSSWDIFSRNSSSATSETVTGLTNGTSYIFRVSAINDPGTGTASTSSGAVTPKTIPSAPTSLVVTPGNAQVSIAFTAGATGGSAISDYIIEYSSNSGSSWNTFTHTASTSSSQVVSGLTNYTSYIFRLTAKNIVGNGEASQSTSPISPRGTLTSIAITRQSVGNTSGEIFSIQPQITLKDQNSATLSTDIQTVVTVTVNSGGILLGSTSATSNAGVATFSGLALTGTDGSTYILTYSAPGVSSVTQSITLAISSPATITLSLSTNLLIAEKGKVSTINAAVSTPGKVTFYANGKAIPGCIKKSASTSVLCSWKPAIQGRVTALKALLVPTSSSYQNVFSPILGITATRRSGLR